MTFQYNDVHECHYCRIYAEYNQSRDELEVAREIFEEGIEKARQQAVRKALFGFVGDTAKVVKVIIHNAFLISMSVMLSDQVNCEANGEST